MLLLSSVKVPLVDFASLEAKALSYLSNALGAPLRRLLELSLKHLLLLVRKSSIARLLQLPRDA